MNVKTTCLNDNGKPTRLKSSLLLFLALLLGFITVKTTAQTPVGANGQLSISGSQMVNEEGTPIQLRGMSTHGPQWFSSCINFDAMNALVNDWGIDVLRLAMYVQEDGYVTNPEFWKGWIDDMVDMCELYGVYCLIDWHVHRPGDPWENIEESKDFWAYMSNKHANKKHVIYEICNEPNNVTWPRVKTYAEEIIPIIRENDSTSIIIVGTPTWSQDVDIAAKDPLAFDNIMYALHFYAGTHGQSLINKADFALKKGLALMVTEWGTSEASGDNGPYKANSNKWLGWMKDNGISWCNWSYSDKDETSANLLPGSCLSNQWNNTSETGTFIKENILVPEDSWAGTGGNINPISTISAPEGAAIMELGNSISITATSSDSDGEITKLEIYANEELIGEAALDSFTIEWQPTATGIYDITAVATDNLSATGKSLATEITVVEEIIQYAYPEGEAHIVPGKINAVMFDVGGEGIAYHDADAVHKGSGIREEEGVDTEPYMGIGNVGYVVNKEWLEYTINVESSGIYDIELTVASQPGGGLFHLDFDNENLTGSIEVGSTGSWGSYQKVKIKDIELTTGQQVMRLTADRGDFNFSQFSFIKTEDLPEPTPPTASFSVDPVIGKINEVITFNAAASTDDDGEIVSYIWDFGDSNSATGKTTSHKYTRSGIFAATLTVTDNDDFVNSMTTNIIINDTLSQIPINKKPRITPKTGDAPLLVTFDGSNLQDDEGSIIDYIWDFGDGNEATGETVSHTYLSQGDYTSTLTVMFASGGVYTIPTTISVTKPDTYPCDIATNISIPFVHDGAGEYCWIADESFDYVSSWNAQTIEINGEDYTNKWDNKLPEPIDGKYYIHYISSVPWSHFQASVNKSATQKQARKQTIKILASPNPFNTCTTLELESANSVKNIKIYNQLGRVVQTINKVANNKLTIGEDLVKGFYLVKVETTKGSQIIKICKR